MSVATYETTNTKPLAYALLALATVGVAFGTVVAPWPITGAVCGAIVLGVALLAPLALVAVMLMIGPINLSFMTGGFKALLPELGGLDMNGIRLLGVTAGFLAYIMFTPRARAAALEFQGRTWIVFLAFAAGTLLVSMDRMEGLRLLLKITYPFLTFLIVIGLADSREKVELLMKCTLVAALSYALIINPILALGGGYRIDHDGFLRVGGLGSGDNPFAFYLTAILLIVFTRFILRMQLRYLCFSLIIVAWLALTGTRIAALAALVGIASIGLLAAIAAKNRKALAGCVIAVAVIAAVLLPNVMQRSLGFTPTPGDLFQLMRNPIALYESINWQGRQVLWAILWAAFMASPIVGLGLGSSTAVIRETFGDFSLRVAHNEYMRIATDTGIVGVLLYAIAIGSWLVAAFRLSRTGDRATNEFAFAAMATMLAWGVIAFTDNPIDYYSVFTQYIGFLLAGAMVMSATRRSTESR